IVGFGNFARYARFPAWYVWEAFGIKNGASSLEEMLDRINAIRGNHRSDANSRDLPIGCLMIADPVFFARSDWITSPADWPRNAVQGTTYDLDLGEGRRVWQECLARARKPLEDHGVPAVAVVERYGQPALVTPRLGQGIF